MYIKYLLFSKFFHILCTYLGIRNMTIIKKSIAKTPSTINIGCNIMISMSKALIESALNGSATNAKL